MTSNQPWWLAWPTAEVAAAILPLFSYPSSEKEHPALASIVSWCKTGQYRKPVKIGDVFKDPDTRAIAEAMRVLEHANLVMRDVSGGDVTWVSVGLTRLGRDAIATNTVRQHLGLGDTPPTA